MAASDGTSSVVQAKRSRRLGCSAGFQALGKQLHSCCEPYPPGEEPAHARLQRMHEEHDREMALAKEQAEANRVAQEKAQELWEAELKVIVESRKGMADEELREDCLKYFECAEVLFQQHAEKPGGEGGKEGEEHHGEEEDGNGLLETGSAAESSWEPRGPEGPLECWLAQTLGAEVVAAAEAEEKQKVADGAEEGAAASPPRRQQEAAAASSAAAAAPGGGGASCRWSSFGELPVEAATHQLATSLLEALSSSAALAELQAAERAGGFRREPSNFDAQFEALLVRFAIEEDDDENRKKNGKEEEEEAAQCAATKAAKRAAEEEEEALVEALRDKAKRYRAVAQRLHALAPCLEGDPPSTRLVLALSIMDLQGGDVHNVEERLSRRRERERGGTAGKGSSNHGRRAALKENRNDLLSGFRAPLAAISVADVCWALCSEKRHLIMERMLPSATADGRWFWPQIRRTGVCWWLCGAGSKGAATPAAALQQLDAMATKLAQSAVARLRHYEKTGVVLGGAPCNYEEGAEADTSSQIVGGLGGSSTRLLQRLADEAVFWYIVMGTRLEKLKALLKTGILRAEPALMTIFEHPRRGEKDFIRKNAFRLMQLHRYHLSVAFFVLGNHLEDAARVAATHLHDLQLMLFLVRRQPETSTLLLQHHLPSSARAGSPWLCVLLAWHTGDERAAWQCIEAAGSRQPPTTEEADVVLQEEEMEEEGERSSLGASAQEPESALLDGCLWFSAAEASSESPAEVMRLLFSPLHSNRRG